MTKKTKKGGASILENIGIIKDINKKGLYIADDIDYNIRQGKKNDLIKKYENSLNEAKKDVIRAKEAKNRKIEDEDIENKRRKNTIEERKLTNNKIQYFITLLSAFLKSLLNFLLKIFLILIKIFEILFNLFQSIFTGIKNLFNLGGGVILKTIILILIIILIFFAVNGVFNKDGSISKEKMNKLISTDKDYSSFLITTKTPNFFEKISSSFYNIIPDNYKFQFNFFKNKVNSIIGNDIYENVGTPRPIITTGKNDGIYHIKKENDNLFTYTTLKPTDINIELDSLDAYPNIDYNKLPNLIKKYLNINSLSIPIKLENNNWVYDINKIYNTEDSKKQPLKDLDPHYKLPFIETSKNNEFKFNKIKANIYNDDDKRMSIMLDKMFTYKNNEYMYPFKFDKYVQ